MTLSIRTTGWWLASWSAAGKRRWRRWDRSSRNTPPGNVPPCRPFSGDEVEQVRRLAADLPALWHAETTTPVDRKRLLRLAVAEVTITVHAAERTADISLLWSGGARTSHRVSCPPHGWHLRSEQRVLTLIRELAGEHADHHIADRLNALGLRTRTGKPWTYDRVASVRHRHAIPTRCPIHTRGRQDRADGLMPAAVAARRLGLSLAAVRVWAQHGVLASDQRTPCSKIWVRLAEDDVARLGGDADVTGLPTVSEVAAQTCATRSTVWQRVRDGEFVAYRSVRGQDQWEWRLQPAEGFQLREAGCARTTMGQHHEP